MSSLQSTVLMLAISYAVIGALLLAFLIFSRLSWWLKAAAIVLTSGFYVVNFVAVQTLLGWASPDPLPPYFKLLQTRIVEPHSNDEDPGTVYFWVEALDEDNRPKSAPRAYRLPYSAKLADRTAKAATEIAAGRQQAGRAADYGMAEGTLNILAQIIPALIVQTPGGGDASSGASLTEAGEGGPAFTPLLPPRMPAKDEQ